MVSSTLIVKNLETETTVNDLKEAFKKYGKVNDVAIDDDSTSATVVFARVKAAEKALASLNGKDVCGSIVKISMEDEESEIESDGEDVDNNEASSSNAEDEDVEADKDESDEDLDIEKETFQQTSKTCRNCSQEGHIAKFCPQDSENQKKPFEKVTCFKCGKFGHKSRACKVGGSSMSCYNCAQDGHMSRDCPSKQSGEGVRLCFKCKQSGHISRECPNKSEIRSEDRACYKCGQSGHMLRECKNKPTSDFQSTRKCFKCGDANHISRDCTKSGGPVRSGGNNNFRKSRQSPYSKKNLKSGGNA